MTKTKVKLVCLAIVLIAGIIAAGCTMGAGFSLTKTTTVVYSEKVVALKGDLYSVEYYPEYQFTHLPVYVVCTEYSRVKIAKADLGKRGIAVRDPALIRKLDDLKNKKGRYCEITIGKVSGTNYWEVTDIQCA
ncbi:MAG: hypothetical protein PHW71_00070 [Candidatus Pacebacteria bacterium]|nr:hypothetical protein [Candidatus Paceibacterota bacterium]MDD5555152.1 hypothetical protein [Candidatus Paceibacterota bacterium]